MDTLISIEQRRSIRKYKQTPIDKNVVTDILNCGRLAPSAKNRQPWRFLVVTNKILILKIADIMIENNKKQDSKLNKLLLNVNSSVVATAKVIKQAPVLVLIYKEKNINWQTGDNLSIGACIQNMCLRACELNLGSLWIRDTVYAAEEILDFLKIDSTKFELNSAITFGFPDESPKARPRKNLDEITIWLD